MEDKGAAGFDVGEFEVALVIRGSVEGDVLDVAAFAFAADGEGAAGDLDVRFLEAGQAEPELRGGRLYLVEAETGQHVPGAHLAFVLIAGQAVLVGEVHGVIHFADAVGGLRRKCGCGKVPCSRRHRPRGRLPRSPRKFGRHGSPGSFDADGGEGDLDEDLLPFGEVPETKPGVPAVREDGRERLGEFRIEIDVLVIGPAGGTAPALDGPVSDEFKAGVGGAVPAASVLQVDDDGGVTDGTLLAVYDGSTGTAGRIYAGSLTLVRTAAGTLPLEGAAWEGGRILSGTGNDKLIYQITDHLGSVRVIKDGEGTVLQRFDYYPFGSESRVWTAGTSTPQSALRYRFGGKEIAGQTVGASALAGIPAAAAGSPYLDFGARVYDPRTAAWLSQDPLSEKYYSISPYAYCAGNPISLIDPNGQDWYTSGTGLKWFDSTAPEYWDEEVLYSWVGVSASFEQNDGTFLNFYQNYQIGEPTSTPQNAESLILNSPALAGYLMSKDSHLPEYAKTSLMMGYMHQGQKDFLTHPVTHRTIDALSLFLGATDLVELFAKNIIAKSPLTFDNMIYMAKANGLDKKYIGRVFGRDIQQDIKDLAKTYGGKVTDTGDRLFFKHEGRVVGTHLSTSMKVQTLDIPLGGPTGKKLFKIRYMP